MFSLQPHQSFIHSFIATICISTYATLVISASRWKACSSFCQSVRILVISNGNLALHSLDWFCFFFKQFHQGEQFFVQEDFYLFFMS
ncbi:hypothetical protein T06_2362 [Trichinella sp. T6]|nr:hypothetical protein T06_2362 [Trichinella sp. T6]